MDPDALGIQRAGQLRRVGAALDSGDLLSREGDHLVVLVIPEEHVEIVGTNLYQILA